MASELVRRLRENDPHGWPIASKETMTEAADALDARDRDVAELVAALGTMLNDTQSVADMAYVKAIYAKHKGGA